MTTFKEYVDKKVKEQKTYRTPFLKEFSERSGIAMVTLTSVYKGVPLARYEKAKTISDLTGGKVSIKELCEKDG